MAKIALNENMHINYDKTKKLANYNNRNYSYYHKSIEIIYSQKTCNNMEHFTVDDK